VPWACDFQNWSATRLRPARFPAAATLSRRVEGVAVGAFLRLLEPRLRERGERRLLALREGKPLPVSGVRKDPDARRGRGAGGPAEGYKLPSLWWGGRLPEAWDVTAWNAAASVVGQPWLRQAPGAGSVRADGHYDSGPLDDEAAPQGYQLMTPLPANAGQG